MCYELKNIEIPDSVTTIGARAFSPCAAESIIVSNNTESIGEEAFGAVQHTGAEEVLFPNGINSAITIPENKWGASKVVINGIEWVPENSDT